MPRASRLCYPVSIVFTALNLAGAGFAAALEQGEHAGVHLLLAGVGGWWVTRMQRRRAAAAALPAERDERLEALESELEQQRRELADAHERLDFAERLLSQAADARRTPERLP